MWDKSQPGISQPGSLAGTCLTLPIWDFCGPKKSKNGKLLFFPVYLAWIWIQLSKNRSENNLKVIIRNR